MCGRYASSRRPEDLIEEFEVVDSRVPEPLAPDYNVAPTKEVYAVVERPPSEEAEERAASGSCGCCVGAGAVLGQGPLDRQPDDQRADGDGRREAGVPAGLRHAPLPAARRRLLRVVPHRGADQGGQAAKQPFFIRPKDGGVLAMAGLYEIWRDPTKDEDAEDAFRWTCTVITTDAEDDVGQIHDRMPLMVEPDRWAAWLDPRTARTRCSTCWCRPRPGGSRPTRCRPWSATCATTAPSCSSRSPLEESRRREPEQRIRHPARRGPAGHPPRPPPFVTLLLSHGAGGGIDARDLTALAYRAAAPRRQRRAARAAVEGGRPQGRHRAGHPRRRPAWPPPTTSASGPRSSSAAARPAPGPRPGRRRARRRRLPGAVLPAAPARQAGEVAARRAARGRRTDPGGPGRAGPDGPARGVPRRPRPRRPRRRARRRPRPQGAEARPGSPGRRRWRSWSSRRWSGWSAKSSAAADAAGNDVRDGGVPRRDRRAGASRGARRLGGDDKI